ncbi:MAG: hypothetical protein MJ003_05750 [Paludibacteraceae bacterium]|nr:hypothetical protein [Paludibacteraceae bacterium]
MKNLKLISVLALGLMLALVSCNKEDKAKRENADKILDFAESALETDGKDFEKTILAQGFQKVSDEGGQVIYQKGEDEGWNLFYANGIVTQADYVKMFESSKYKEYLNEFIINTDQILKRYKTICAGEIMTNTTELQTSSMSQFKNEAKKTNAADFTIKVNHKIEATAFRFPDRGAQTRIVYGGDNKFSIWLGAAYAELDD